MQRDPTASDRARKAEQREAERSGLISMKLGPGPGGDQPAPSSSGFKKAGFRSITAPSSTASRGAELRKAFATDDDVDQTDENLQGSEHGTVGNAPPIATGQASAGSDDSEAESYSLYDPRHPTSP